MLPNSKNKLKILVLDDDLFLAEVLLSKLDRDGFTSLIAHSEDEAYEIVAKEKPSLVLVDLDLGVQGSGLSFIQQIRLNIKYEHIPIIALSNTGDDDEKEKAIELGADLYLVKAYVDTEELLYRIKLVLQKHRVDLPYFHKKLSFKNPADLKFIIEEELSKSEDEIKISDLTDSIIVYAFITQTSDIHIEPHDDKILIRYRIDGVLHDVFKMSKTLHPKIIDRVKALAGLRLGESTMDQEGHFRSRIENPPKEFEVRVSTLMTYYGENAVLRLLSKRLAVTSLKDLLMSDGDLKKVEEAIKKPFGMILITGPTGSGKSTTLYTILRKLNTREVSIVSIEDPVEYSIEGVQQIQVNPKIGLTFAQGLRTILRQDPDIIMVGEIRDEETAGIAVNAALTGHLLLSTLHTSDAVTTLPRLLDMNIEPFLVASTVQLAISQRLVRKICEKCRKEKEIKPEELASLREKLPAKLMTSSRVFYVGDGCSECGGTGYEGRIGVYEVLEVNDQIRKVIMERANTEQIRKVAMETGMTTMLEDGFKKAKEGLTTIEEILRVIHE